jgi:hypothetical protein
LCLKARNTADIPSFVSKHLESLPFWIYQLLASLCSFDWEHSCSLWW